MATQQRFLFHTLLILTSATLAVSCGRADDLVDELRDILHHGSGGGSGHHPPDGGAQSDGGAQTVEVGEGERCEAFTAPPLRVCKPGLFCMPLAGSCRLADVGGICETTPRACTKEFNPVCGCDGKTYGNDCTRRAARVALDHSGACPQAGAMCGGIAGLPCAEGLFCDPPIGMCNVADVAGQCRVTPQVCTDIFDSVCGCDGKTYANDCGRQTAGVPEDHAGACR